MILLKFQFIAPYLPGDVSAEKVNKWFSDTIDRLEKIGWSEDAKKAGVGLLSAYYIFPTETSERLFFADHLVSYRELTPRELSMFPKQQFKSGAFATTYFAECRKYLPYLVEKFKENGGKMILKRINSLEELAGIYHVVFNCPGLSARTLVKDDQVFPIRGQLLRVRAPWLKHSIIAGDSYMLPNTDVVIVGGTRTVNDWNANADPNDTKTIYENACKVFPGLKGAEIVNVWAGLRPGRTRPRIEKESFVFGNNKLEVIHNYGHGGSGVTLSWGCANEAVDLLTQTLTEGKLFKSNI